jgi:methionyl-tRNA synthetase
MQGQRCLVLCNLKPAAMRGITSHAMVLCASDAEHTKVEFVVPPAACAPGERIVFAGCEAVQPEEQLNPKKKVWETVQPDLKTTAEKVPVWKDLPFSTKHGLCTVATIANGNIK